MLHYGWRNQKRSLHRKAFLYIGPELLSIIIIKEGTFYNHRIGNVLLSRKTDPALSEMFLEDRRAFFGEFQATQINSQVTPEPVILDYPTRIAYYPEFIAFVIIALGESHLGIIVKDTRIDWSRIFCHRLFLLFLCRLEALIFDVVILEPFFGLLDRPALRRKPQGLRNYRITGLALAFKLGPDNSYRLGHFYLAVYRTAVGPPKTLRVKILRIF